MYQCLYIYGMYAHKYIPVQLSKLYSNIFKLYFRNNNYLSLSCINTIFFVFYIKKYQYQIFHACPVHLKVYLNMAINRLTRRILVNSMYVTINNTTMAFFSGQRSISPDLQRVSLFVQVPASSDGSFPTTWKQITKVYPHTAIFCLLNNFHFHASTSL